MIAAFCFAAGRAANLAEFIRQAVYLISFGLIGAFVLMGLAVLFSVRKGAEVATTKPAPPKALSPAQGSELS